MLTPCELLSTAPWARLATHFRKHSTRLHANLYIRACDVEHPADSWYLSEVPKHLLSWA